MRLEDLIRKIRLSIAQVSIGFGNQPPVGGPVGTGFIVGSGRYLVTAKHVVDSVPINSQEAKLYAGLAGVDEDRPDLQIRGAFLHVPLRLIGTDARNDIALLEIMMPPDATSVSVDMVEVDTAVKYSAGRTGPMALSGAPVLEGLDIAVSGFPLSAASLVTTRGIVASTFAPYEPMDPDSPISYLCDVTAIYGNSGGPVYRTSDGSVIGLCRAVKLAGGAATPHTVPLLVVTPVAHIVALMRGSGVEVQEVSRPRPPAKKKRK